MGTEDDSYRDATAFFDKLGVPEHERSKIAITALEIVEFVTNAGIMAEMTGITKDGISFTANSIAFALHVYERSRAQAESESESVNPVR